MKFKPLFDKVVVEPKEDINQTSSGVIIPKSIKDQAKTGIVKAKGPDVKVCEVGDVIMYADFAGENKVKIEDEEYLLMRETDIFGVFTK